MFICICWFCWTWCQTACMEVVMRLMGGHQEKYWKILGFIGTSGNSYFQDLFWSIGESWKLKNFTRWPCSSGFFFVLPSSVVVVLGVACPRPQMILDRVGLDLPGPSKLPDCCCFPIPPALLGWVLLAFLTFYRATTRNGGFRQFWEGLTHFIIVFV